MTAARAGTQMQARQTFRTIDRMERRRGYLRNAESASSQPDEPREQPRARYETATQSAPTQPAYADELKALAQLHEQGVLTAEEYEAKKKHVLGI